MQEHKSYQHLPHIDGPGSYQFITFRTKESLDVYLKQLYRSSEPEKIKQYKMDQYLDRSQNGTLLYGDILKEVKAYYLGYDKTVFELEAVSIMPNHIHVLIRQNSDLSNVIRVLKGGAAHIVNKVLGSKGAVWSRDYYDKIIRDEKYYRIVYEYIKYNALKAGLDDANDRFYGRYD
jgi:REP element-mobilizing transposase RayT